MNLTGHFWCDACDEPAFGAACQKCHGAARWIADRALQGDAAATRAHQAAKSHEFTPVDPERARELFQGLLENVRNHQRDAGTS